MFLTEFENIISLADNGPRKTRFDFGEIRWP